MSSNHTFMGRLLSSLDESKGLLGGSFARRHCPVLSLFRLYDGPVFVPIKKKLFILCSSFFLLISFGEHVRGERLVMTHNASGRCLGLSSLLAALQQTADNQILLTQIGAEIALERNNRVLRQVRLIPNTQETPEATRRVMSDFLRDLSSREFKINVKFSNQAWPNAIFGYETSPQSMWPDPEVWYGRHLGNSVNPAREKLMDGLFDGYSVFCLAMPQAQRGAHEKTRWFVASRAPVDLQNSIRVVCSVDNTRPQLHCNFYLVSSNGVIRVTAGGTSEAGLIGFVSWMRAYLGEWWPQPVEPVIGIGPQLHQNGDTHD
ncbi:MAG: hypothetical protein ACK5TQ_06450 [Acetobacteraceae bacterium]